MAYHILKNKDKGFEYIKDHEIAKDVGISSLPEADIVAIDCRRLSSDTTLWGEIARRINKYDLMEKYDRGPAQRYNVFSTHLLFILC
ncbi:MAG: hypothetical protein ACRD8Z_10180 [Nitrososphaeraceae archaeon]